MLRPIIELVVLPFRALFLSYRVLQFPHVILKTHFSCLHSFWNLWFYHLGLYFLTVGHFSFVGTSVSSRDFKDTFFMITLSMESVVLRFRDLFPYCRVLQFPLVISETHFRWLRSFWNLWFYHLELYFVTVGRLSFPTLL